MNSRYKLHTDIDGHDGTRIELTLYAVSGDYRTGLMNTNLLGTYLTPPHSLGEDSTTPLVTTWEFADRLVESILENWGEWERFLDEDREDQLPC